MSKKKSRSARPDRQRLSSRIDQLFTGLEQAATPPPGDPIPQAGFGSPTSGLDTQAAQLPGLPARHAPTLPVDFDKQVSGFRADEIQVSPAETFLTSAGLQSMEAGVLVVQPSQEGAPAALALTAPFAGDQNGLLLEFLDLDSDRKWSEDELLLVEQVSGQLSLALENAQLFTQTQARAEELGKLREISLELAQEQGDLQRVLDLLARRAMELLNSDSSAIWLYRPEMGRLELTTACENGTPAEMGETLLAADPELSEQAFSDARSLMTPTALAVPLSWQNQVTGVLQVSRKLRFPSHRRAYSGNEQRLAELLSGQGSAVIQNARLFAETQAAYRSLELRERYQKNIAQSAAALTERGSQALPEVLQLLAEATCAAQVRFIQSYPSNGSPGFRVEAEWLSPGSPAWAGKLLPASLPESEQRDWLQMLGAGACLQTNAQAGSLNGSSLLDLFACGSLLHVGVLQTGSQQSCLSFCSPDPDRRWGPDETSALQTAASTLYGALAREDLFHQVQANLAETEALYQASARLNSASSYEEVLTVLRDHTLLGDPSAVSVTIGLFNQAYEPGQPLPEYLPLARWSQSGAKATPASHYPLSDWPAVVEFASAAVYIDGRQNDLRIPHPLTASLQALMPSSSVVLAPLTVAGRWIGQIFAAFDVDHIEPGLFSDAALRRLTSLAGQASVAVQNLNQLREIQSRARQEALTREIGVQISSSIDLDTVIKTTARSLGQALGVSQVVVRLTSELEKRRSDPA